MTREQKRRNIIDGIVTWKEILLRIMGNEFEPQEFSEAAAEFSARKELLYQFDSESRKLVNQLPYPAEKS